MFVVTYGRQCKHLRLHSLLQIKHHAHHTRTVLRHAHAGDVGIVGLDFAHPFFDGGVQFQAFNVNGQTWRGGHEGVFGFQRNIRFQSDACVISGRPHAHRHQAGAFADVGPAQHQCQARSLEPITSLNLHEQMRWRAWLSRALEVIDGLAAYLHRLEHTERLAHRQSVSVEDRAKATCLALGWATLQFSVLCWQTNLETLLLQTLGGR